MKPFDRVVIATEDFIYPHSVELVAKAWKKLFDCEVSVAFLVSENKELFKYQNPVKEKMPSIDEFGFFPIMPDIPVINQMILAKYYLFASHKDEVCLAAKPNIIPLRKELLEESLLTRPKGSLIFFGEGKLFTTQYMTCEGVLMQALINPYHVLYVDYIRSFIEVDKPFVEENLFRLLFNENKASLKWECGPELVTRMYFKPEEAWQVFKLEKLEDINYTQLILPVPFDQYQTQLKELIDYIEGQDDHSN